MEQKRANDANREASSEESSKKRNPENEMTRERFEKTWRDLRLRSPVLGLESISSRMTSPRR